MIERYTFPEMAALWAREARFAAWYRVEIAWLETLEERGEVPAGTAAACQGAKMDLARLDGLEATTRHEVIAFLEMVREQLGEEGRWLHHGLTSSDVMDSGVALQATAAADLVLAALDDYLEALVGLAERTLGLLAAGRTHGMHAEPMPFGLRFARFAAAAKRDRARLAAARAGVATGKLAGAVGAYAFYGPGLEAETLARLGLAAETAPSQVVARDRHADLLGALALCGADVEAFATEVRHLQRTEVGEAEEPFTAGQKGSSAMPHKRNPIVCERLCGLARLLRGFAQTGYENVALWHERDISHSSTERLTLPTATATLHYMLVRAARVARGLVVNEEAVASNLGAGGGALFTSAALLALVEAGMSREAAYELVQGLAFAAQEGGVFKDLFCANEQVRDRLGEEAAEVFSADRYLAHAQEILARVKEE